MLSFSKPVLIKEVERQSKQAVIINFDAIKLKKVTLSFKYSQVITAERAKNTSCSDLIISTLSLSLVLQILNENSLGTNLLMFRLNVSRILPQRIDQFRYI